MFLLGWRQTIALALYVISPIEAVMLSFGLVSNSVCRLDKFLDWMLDHQQLADYRFGFVQSVHTYRRYTKGHDGKKTSRSIESSIMIGLMNHRGIENWVQVASVQGTLDDTSCVCTFCLWFCTHIDVRD